MKSKGIDLSVIQVYPVVFSHLFTSSSYGNSVEVGAQKKGMRFLDVMEMLWRGTRKVVRSHILAYAGQKFPYGHLHETVGS